MKLKKILTTLVAVMMLASLAACSSNNTTPAEETEKNTKDTIVTEQPTETPSGKVDENGREDDHGISDVKPSGTKPTDEVTPTEEPTSEVTPVVTNYDPEEVTSYVDESGREYATAGRYWYTMNGLQSAANDRIVRINLNSASSHADICAWNDADLDEFCSNTGFPVEIDAVGERVYPFPWNMETALIYSIVGTRKPSQEPCPDSCIVFVKEGETFDMNGLLEQARRENGANYTIDQMIRDEYANIICFDETHLPTGLYAEECNKFAHEINVSEVFPEPGTYQIYSYVFYPETQEWHRDTTVDGMTFNIVDYSDYDLTIEF